MAASGGRTTFSWTSSSSSWATPPSLPRPADGGWDLLAQALRLPAGATGHSAAADWLDNRFAADEQANIHGFPNNTLANADLRNTGLSTEPIADHLYYPNHTPQDGNIQDAVNQAQRAVFLLNLNDRLFPPETPVDSHGHALPRAHLWDSDYQQDTRYHTEFTAPVQDARYHTELTVPLQDNRCHTELTAPVQDNNFQPQLNLLAHNITPSGYVVAYFLPDPELPPDGGRGQAVRGLREQRHRLEQ